METKSQKRTKSSEIKFEPVVWDFLIGKQLVSPSLNCSQGRDFQNVEVQNLDWIESCEMNVLMQNKTYRAKQWSENKTIWKKMLLSDAFC